MKSLSRKKISISEEDYQELMVAFRSQGIVSFSAGMRFLAKQFLEGGGAGKQAFHLSSTDVSTQEIESDQVETTKDSEENYRGFGEYRDGELIYDGHVGIAARFVIDNEIEKKEEYEKEIKKLNNKYK